MSYYVATKRLKCADDFIEEGELVPNDAPGLDVILITNQAQELPGDPPSELLPEKSPKSEKKSQKKQG